MTRQAMLELLLQAVAEGNLSSEELTLALTNLPEGEDVTTEAPVTKPKASGRKPRATKPKASDAEDAEPKAPKNPVVFVSQEVIHALAIDVRGILLAAYTDPVRENKILRNASKVMGADDAPAELGNPRKIPAAIKRVKVPVRVGKADETMTVGALVESILAGKARVPK
jgi:hypothetical protein